MNEHHTGVLLTALRRAITMHRLYGVGHPLTDESLVQAAEAASALAGGDGRGVITVVDGSLYLDRWLLPATSLAYDELLQTLESRGIESLTFLPPVSTRDMAQLITRVAEKADGADPGGTILVNQAPWTREELQSWEGAASRSAYASSLHVLRAMGTSVQQGEAIDMSRAATVVGSLLDLSVGEPAAALLLSTMKSHHEYTFYHSVNTCILTLALGRLIGLGDADLVLLGMGALLHDIGKLGVSSVVLHHPGRLSEEQRQEMELHPLVGAEAILTASEPGQEVVATVALEHHARYDGSGYPGLDYFRHHPGEGGAAPGTHPLHLFSRLVAIADTYDAITSRRSYRRADTPDHALQVLLDGAGSWWDPDAVLAFIHLMGAYPPGSVLRLRSGRVVLVTGTPVHPGASHPAMLVIDESGHRRTGHEPVTFDSGDVVDVLTSNEIDVPPAAVLAWARPAPSPSD